MWLLLIEKKKKDNSYNTNKSLPEANATDVKAASKVAIIENFILNKFGCF